MWQNKKENVVSRKKWMKGFQKRLQKQLTLLNNLALNIICFGNGLVSMSTQL